MSPWGDELLLPTLSSSASLRELTVRGGELRVGLNLRLAASRAKLAAYQAAEAAKLAEVASRRRIALAEHAAATAAAAEDERRRLHEAEAQVSRNQQIHRRQLQLRERREKYQGAVAVLAQTRAAEGAELLGISLPNSKPRSHRATRSKRTLTPMPHSQLLGRMPATGGDSMVGIPSRGATPFW